MSEIPASRPRYRRGGPLYPIAGAEGGISDQVAAAMAAVAEGRLKLDERRLVEHDLKLLNQGTLPAMSGALTGMIPQDYAGPYAGSLTWNALSSLVDSRGIYLDDPRVPENLRGKNTLSRDQLEVAANTQMWRERTDVRDFNASRSDADRLFAAAREDVGRVFTEEQRQQLQDQTNKDLEAEATYGVPIINGRQVPAWLASHKEWAYQSIAQNGGQVPGYTDLVKALAPFGQVPEDYNGGQPYPGQVPAAAPGILFDPQHGWTDAATGQSLDAQRVGQVAAERWERAMPMRTGADGQPIFALPAGASMVGVTVGPTGKVSIPSLGQGGAPTAAGGDPLGQGPTMQTQGQMVGGVPGGGGTGATAGLGTGPTAQGGGTVYTGPSGPNVPTMARPQAAGTATAAIGQGQLMSPAQRALIEQGRSTDLQNAQLANEQRIAEKRVEYDQAIAVGNQELANRAQNELTTLNNAKLELERQGQAFKQAFDVGELTGNYDGYDTMAKQQLTQGGEQFNKTLAENARQFDSRLGFDQGVATGSVGGQQTVEAGALMGNFNGQSTLAGQQAYGGSAYVGGGQTLEAMQALGQIGGQNTLAKTGQDADIALRAAQMASAQTPADVFQAAARARAMEGSDIPGLVNSLASGGRIPAFGQYTLRRPQAQGQPFLQGMASPAGAGGSQMGVVNQTSTGNVIGRVQAGDPQAFMQRPAAAGGSAEDWLTPKAGSITGGQGVRLQRPDRIGAQRWGSMTESERGILGSAYQDQGVNQADLPGLIAAGAPGFKRAARARWAA